MTSQRHPTPEGTYLAAATVYATLCKKSPLGLKYSATLNADTARYLQPVAWETVQQYSAAK